MRGLFGGLILLLGLVNQTDGQLALMTLTAIMPICVQIMLGGMTPREIQICINGEQLNGGQFYIPIMVMKCTCMNILAAQGDITLAQGDARIKMINTLGQVI